LIELLDESYRFVKFWAVGIIFLYVAALSTSSVFLLVSLSSAFDAAFDRSGTRCSRRCGIVLFWLDGFSPVFCS
jgi:hypothetical protein